MTALAEEWCCESTGGMIMACIYIDILYLYMFYVYNATDQLKIFARGIFSFWMWLFFVGGRYT